MYRCQFDNEVNATATAIEQLSTFYRVSASDCQRALFWYMRKESVGADLGYQALFSCAETFQLAIARSKVGAKSCS